MKCDDCQRATLREYGYSNYTVEGTTFSCPHHPEEKFDHFYGEEPKLKYAEKCPHFLNGDPTYYSVEDD